MDKEIKDFATLQQASDDDLLLVSSEDETYNIKFGTFKEALQGDADRAAAGAEAAAQSAAQAASLAGTANANANTAMADASAAKTAAASAAAATLTAQAAATRAASSAAQAQSSAEAAAKSLSAIQDDVAQGFVQDLEAVDDGLKVTYNDGGTKVIEIKGGSGGLAFETWAYDADTHYLHLYDADGLDVIDPVYIPGGGGGGSSAGSTLTFAMQTATTFAVAETSTEAIVGLIFRSVDATTQTATGSGTLQIYVGGSLKRTMTIPQGENRINVREYITTGANALKLIITDGYGNTATRGCSISVETLSLEWNLGNTEKLTGDLTVNLTPTGSYTKTVYISVDGKPYDSFSVSTTGRRQTRTITEQAHGGHIVSAYCTMDLDGTLLTSNVLTCAVAWIGSSNKPVVACNTIPAEMAQYSTVNVIHRIIDPLNNPATVDYLVNGAVYKTETVDQTEQVWSYRLNTVGPVNLAIRCGSTTYPIAITVTGIGSDIQEVTDSLEVKVEPSSMTSLRDWAYGGYAITLSDDFDEVNGGLINDADGVRCIRITAGDRLTLNYPLFGGDARKNGMEAKIIYAVRDSSRKDTVAISSLNAGIGLEIKANNAYVYGNQTTLTLSTCEDEKTELDVNIQPDSENRLMYIWEKASTFAYKQYATDENFTHGTAQGITFGSDDADVYLYLFRAYSRDLTANELRANFIADGADSTDILARHSRNDIYDSTGAIDIEKAATKNPETHFITIHAPRMTIGKKDTVNGSFDHLYVGGGAKHTFTSGMSMVVQGTSSVEHAETAGGNLTLKMTDVGTDDSGKTGPGYIVMGDGTKQIGYAMNGVEKSIPITSLNFKKNIASEDHIVNKGTAEWYNTYQPSKRQARMDDPRVRDCMESVMCAVFFHNTGSTATMVGPDLVGPDETVFFGIGNLCVDKSATEAYQYEPIVIEVKNNTEPQVRFKSNDLSGDKFDNNYEFRYLDESQFSKEEAKALWQEVQNFVYETDYTAATNEALPAPVTIGGKSYTTDSAEYRKARWKAEAPDHFDMPSLFFHDNITLFFLMRDNRAKNMFWSYNAVTGKWSLRFHWDGDTGLCRNNEGYIDIEPGYLDFDIIGTANVFNGADNALFTNMRECNFSELEANFVSCKDAWNIDAFYSYCMSAQEAVCESLWIEDAQHNAIRVMENLGTTAYLERATGRLRLHLKKALTFQSVLVESYYASAAENFAKSASFRGYTPTNWAGVAPNGLVEITPYTDMFINIKAGSTSYHERAYAGVPVRIDITACLGDTEIYLRHAPWIQALGDLSGLYLGEFEALNLTRVRTILIGSSVAGYYNTNFKTASFDNCRKLEELNLGGLTDANIAFDLSPNIYLKKLYTRGSGITGITFAKNGRIEEAHLNALSSLYLNGLFKLAQFDMESYTALTSLTVVNCPVLNTYALVKDADNISRVRLIGIDWTVPVSGHALLMKLYGINGIDDDGYNTDHGIITGAVYFTAITEGKLQTLRDTFPDIEFTYDPNQVLEEYTVKFCDGDGNVLHTQRVERGGSAVDPIAAGYISAPTKSSDVEYNYTYWKWDTNFEYIIRDTTITAQFTATDRFYTVTFANRDGSVLEQHSVKAHGSCSYGGADPFFIGYIWYGWDGSADDVVADTTVTAQFIYPTLPADVKDLSAYDFAYSDKASDRMAYNRAEFAGILLAGAGKTYFAVGDRIKMVPGNRVITDSEIVFSLHGFDHYKLSDGSGFAGTTWYAVGVLNATRQINSANTNLGGWPATPIRRWLNETLYPSLPPFWRSLIKQVQILSSAGNTTPDIVSSNDYLYLMSQAEVGFNTKEVPYAFEVDSGAERLTFACYTDNNSRIKKYYNGTGGAVYWWLRSPVASSTTNFYYVYTGGFSYIGGAGSSNGVAPGFSI